MAKFNIESLIAKHTEGDKVDYVKINDALEKQNKDIVAKEVTKESKKYDKDTVISEFLKEQEFNSMDEFTAFKKNGATADTEAVKRVEKERNEFKGKYEELLPLQGELASFKNRAMLRGKGITDQDKLEFMEYKINKLEGESFEDKVTAYGEANPDAFTEAPPVKPNVITTGTKVGGNPNPSEKLDWEKIVDDRYSD